MPPRNWIAVASAEHARLGRDHRPLGFMQVCHGKRPPLQRIAAGDRVACYAPATVYDGTDRLQSFVSIGVVKPGLPYEFDMGNGFVSWRRDMHYAAAFETPIAPLLGAFEFIENPERWGAKFRFGLFDVSTHDMQLIARAMQADRQALGFQDLPDLSDGTHSSTPKCLLCRRPHNPDHEQR